MPIDDIQQPGENGVQLRQALALAWREAEVETEALRDALMYDNEAVLANHAWLDDFEHHPYDEPSGREGGEVLETRLNLLIAMIGIWMRRQAVIPDAVPVTLGEETLAWETSEPPPPGAHLLVELYFSVRFPFPLVLPAEVSSVEACEDGNRWRVKTQLIQLSRGTRQGIARVIFRYHRRVLRERHAREDGPDPVPDNQPPS